MHLASIRSVQAHLQHTGKRPLASAVHKSGPHFAPRPQHPLGQHDNKSRRHSTVMSLFNFKWPFGSGSDDNKAPGKYDDILKAARTMKKGCELAPATAPEGMELATFAGQSARLLSQVQLVMCGWRLACRLWERSNRSAVAGGSTINQQQHSSSMLYILPRLSVSCIQLLIMMHF